MRYRSRLIPLSVSLVTVLAIILAFAPRASSAASSPGLSIASDYRIFVPFVSSGSNGGGVQIPPATSTATPSPIPSATATWTPIPSATSTWTPVPSPTATPTFTPTPCDSGTQVLGNPSFENGTAPWDFSGFYGASLTTREAYDGQYSAYFGHSGDSVGQGVTVPSWAESSFVYFYWYVISSDSPLTDYDYLEVRVSAPQLVAQYVISNTALRGGWYAAQFPIDNIASYRGQFLSLDFYGHSDFDNATLLPTTTWMIDEVGLVFACGNTAASLGNYPLQPNQHFVAGSPLSAWPKALATPSAGGGTR